MAESNSGGVSGDVSFPKPEAQPPNDPSRLPLGYAPMPKSEENWNARRAVGGALLSVILVPWAAGLLVPYIIPGVGQPGSTMRKWCWILVCFALAAVAIITAVAVWRRRPMGEGRWLLFGILIGLGIAGLLEGTCWWANGC